MGREQVVFKDTRAKADNKAGRSLVRRPKTMKKNISKKDFDKQRRLKRYNKMQERSQLKSEAEKKQTLQKIQKTNATLQERREKVMAEINDRKQKNKKLEDDEWEDIDEHEKEVFEGTGFFEVQDSEAHITAADQKLLS